MDKLTLKAVKNEFTKRGHKPLFKTYKNSNEKLSYFCQCGNKDICYISLIKLKQNQDNCKICIGKKCNKIIYNFKTARNEFIKKGHNPLFKTYKNCNEKLPYKCRCGNKDICYITLNNLKKNGDNCKICSNKKQRNAKYTFKEVKDEFIKRGHYPLFETFNNRTEKLPYICRCGDKNIYYTSIINLKNNTDSCKKCIVEKIKKTNMERYGVEYVSKSDEIKEKIKKTNMKRYGVENPNQSDLIKEKTKKTNIERYGVESVMQNKEILEKGQKTAFKLKPYTFPKSNETVNVQGYEPFCLNDLLKKEKISEKDLLDGYKNRPVIKYHFDGKDHCYHPDIYIPSKNLIIEVKSQYTYDTYQEVNMAKLEATVEAGYDAEIRIYNKNGKREKTIRAV